jgi:hypothetical protein
MNILMDCGGNCEIIRYIWIGHIGRMKGGSWKTVLELENYVKRAL